MVAHPIKNYHGPESLFEKKRNDIDDDNQRAMSKWAGPDYKGR